MVILLRPKAKLAFTPGLFLKWFIQTSGALALTTTERVPVNGTFPLFIHPLIILENT